MNLYAYAGNNPIGFSDPFGLCPPYPCLPGQVENEAEPGPNGYEGMHDKAGAGWYVGMEKLKERLVAGAEAHLPGSGVSVDQVGARWTGNPEVVFDAMSGASMSVGVRVSKSSLGDVMTGSAALAGPVGVQIGWAVGTDGARLTDIRLVAGFTSKISVGASVEIPRPTGPPVPVSIQAVRDATGMIR